MTQGKNPWTADSGVSDYMTSDINVFHQYYSCQENLVVQFVNGTLSKLVGLGLIVISKDLVFESVLLVPNLDYDML